MNSPSADDSSRDGREVKPELQPGVKYPPVGSDVASASSFDAYINMINSEKQLIWQRYQAMLVANSILVSLITTGRINSIWFIVVACLIGILLCMIWLRLNRTGWHLMWQWMTEAARYDWNPYSNPCVIPKPPESRWEKGDSIYRLANRVVLLFLACYLVLLALAYLRVDQ